MEQYRGTIHVDAGHGGEDAGVIWKNHQEKVFNLEYALTLKYLLAKRGYRVKMSRYSDNRPTYSQRTNEAKEGDILISLHFNSFDTYPLIYHKQGCRTSSRFAHALEKELQTGRIWSTKQSHFKRLYIDDAADGVASVLIEIDSIERATHDKNARIDFAEAVVRAVESFIGSQHA